MAETVLEVKVKGGRRCGSQTQETAAGGRGQCDIGYENKHSHPFLYLPASFSFPTSFPA